MNFQHVTIAAAIAHMEGFFSMKSVARRNNNPGNLETPSGTFLHFDQVTTGFQALVADIADNAGKTLEDFLYKYAPPSENNTENYVSVVSSITGIDRKALIDVP